MTWRSEMRPESEHSDKSIASGVPRATRGGVSDWTEKTKDKI